MKKDDIIRKLNEFPYGTDGFWLVAGAALVMYGVRDETGDIDMGCTAEAADRLEKDGVPCSFTESGRRRFSMGSDIEIFENWLYGSVESVCGFPVMSLEGIREMKSRLSREKDLRDIELIDRFLSRGSDKHCNK